MNSVISKVAISFVAIVAISANANAQLNLGALKNKVLSKVQSEVTSAVNNAVNGAEEAVEQKVEEKVEQTVAKVEEALPASVTAVNKPKVQPKEPKPAEVTVKSNIEDVYAAFYYYQELVEEAIELEDVSYLCSIDAQKPFNILYKVIQDHPQKDASTTTNYNESYATFRYQQSAKPKIELIGQPTVYSKNPDQFQRYIENMAWYVDKLNSTEDLNIQGYHLAEALAITKMSIESKDKYMTAERLASPEYQAIASRFVEVWENMSPEYRQYYNYLDGVTTLDGAAAAAARQKAAWAAEAKAVEEANLEHIKNSLEPVPASNWKEGPNPSLEAECLAIVNKANPETKFVKAVLMSPEWQYDYQWGNPISRRVHCWCIYKMANGYYKAVHVSFKQMNQGGGNWDSLKLYGYYNEDYKYIDM